MKDLSTPDLSIGERMGIVTYVTGVMSPLEHILPSEDIFTVADYI